jgi:hypothetical protein
MDVAKVLRHFEKLGDRWLRSLRIALQMEINLIAVSWTRDTTPSITQLTPFFQEERRKRKLSGKKEGEKEKKPKEDKKAEEWTPLTLGDLFPLRECIVIYLMF